MSNRYLITAVHLDDSRGNLSLTIRAGVCRSADLLAAQAVAAFCADNPDHAGLFPVAVASVELSLEQLEKAVTMLKEDVPPETILPKRRGRRPQPGMIPAKQEPLSAEEETTLQKYLKSHRPAWGLGTNAAEEWSPEE